jgi:hypothetical protein
MNIGFKKIGVSLLFVLGMADAMASPLERELARVFQFQRVAVERGEQRNDARVPNERRGDEQYSRRDDAFGNRGGNQADNANENARKQGRMSPEERRALRRQIDEAGHDIYRPKR